MYFCVMLAADKIAAIKSGVAMGNWDSVAGQQMV